MGRYRYKGRQLLEYVDTATAVSSTTVKLPITGAEPAQTTRFNKYGVSCVGGTGSGVDRICTTFAQSTTTITFTPSYATFSTDSIIELWQPGLNATAVNDYINDAVDLVKDDALQEWSSTLLAAEESTNIATDGTVVDADRTHYILPSGSRYLYRVEVYGKSPYVGNGAGNVTTFRAIKDATARTKLSQGFIASDSDVLVRGVVLYLKTTGSPTGTLTVTLETSSSSLPSGSTVTGTSTTLAVSSVGANPQYYFFDFGRPVRLTGGSTYHITITNSAGVDASNYVEWGEDANASYSDGALSLYGGASWTAVTTSDMIFHVLPWTEQWVSLLDSEWNVVMAQSQVYLELLYEKGNSLPGSSPISQRAVDGTPLRLIGLKVAARPSDDTTDLDCPATFIEAKAMSLLLLDLDPTLIPMAQFYENIAQRELIQSQIRTTLPSGARRTTTTG